MVESANVRAGAASRDTWAFDCCYEMLGFPFRVRTNVSRVAVLLGRFLAPFRAGQRRWVQTLSIVARRGDEPFVLYTGKRRYRKAATVAGSIDFLLSYVNERAVLNAKDVVIVHGAAASWNGHGLVLPAPMDSGKTTLVAGLTRAGASYLTDDAVVFDPDACMVQPFPKTLRLEAGSVEAIPGLRRRLSPEYPWPMRLQYHVTPDDLRPHSIGHPCHLRYVIVPSFEKGAATTLEPMPRAAGLLALAQNCSNLDQFGGRAIRVLGEAVRGADCYRLRMGDLDTAVRAVRARIRA